MILNFLYEASLLYIQLTKNRISLPKGGLGIFCTSFFGSFLPFFQSSRVDLNTRNFEKLSKREKQGKI